MQSFETVLYSWVKWVKIINSNQGLVKGVILCFRNPYFYFRHGESTSTASQLNSPASQKCKDLNKVLLLLQDLGIQSYENIRDYYQFQSVSRPAVSNDIAVLVLIIKNVLKWTIKPREY